MRAIILKKTPLAENSEIVAMYSREFGKIRGVARAVKLPKSKLAFALQNLFCSEIEIAPSKSMPIITGAKPLAVFRRLREDLEKVKPALYAAELILKSTADEQPNAALFDLLESFYSHLDKSASGAAHACVYFFSFSALALAGYAIDARKCASCSREIFNADKISFSSHKGGFLCTECAMKFSSARAVTPELYKLFADNYGQDFSAQDQAFSARAAQKNRVQLRAIAKDFAEYILERDLKTSSFFDTI